MTINRAFFIFSSSPTERIICIPHHTIPITPRTHAIPTPYLMIPDMIPAQPTLVESIVQDGRIMSHPTEAAKISIHQEQNVKIKIKKRFIEEKLWSTEKTCYHIDDHIRKEGDKDGDDIPFNDCLCFRRLFAITRREDIEISCEDEGNDSDDWHDK